MRVNVKLKLKWRRYHSTDEATSGLLLLILTLALSTLFPARSAADLGPSGWLTGHPRPTAELEYLFVHLDPKRVGFRWQATLASECGAPRRERE